MRRVPSRVSSWLTPAAWVAAVTAALLLVFPVGFPNYDTIYALVWGRELAHGVSPDYGAALPPTPHPLADLIGLVTTPLGDGAITVTMVIAYASLGLIGYFVYRLGSALVRPLDRRRRRRDRPHPGALPLQRPARLHRPPLHRPLPRRPDGRGEAPPRRLARPRPARPAGLLRPEAWLFSVAYWPTWQSTLSDGPRGARRHPSNGRILKASASLGRQLVRAGGACSARAPLWLAGGACRGRAGAVGAVRRDHDRRPALLADRDPGNGGNAEAQDRAGRPRPLRAAGARRSAAVAGDGRRPRRRRPRLRLPAPPLGARHRRRPPRPRRLRPARLRPASRSSPATRCSPRRSWRSSSPSPCSAGACSNPATPGAARWQLFAGLVALMFVDLAAEPVGPRLPRRHRPHQPGRIECDLTDLVDAGAFEPLCGKIAVPNHRAVPRLAFGLEVKPTEIVSASEEGAPARESATSSPRPAPSSSTTSSSTPTTRPNFHLARGLRPGFAAPGRRKRVLAGLRPLLSAAGRSAALDAGDRGVGGGGEVGIGELDRRRQLDVEVVGGVDPQPQPRGERASRARGRRGCGRR